MTRRGRLAAVVRLAASASPGCTAAVLGLAVLDGALPVVNAWCLKVLLDQLARFPDVAADRVWFAATALVASGLLLALHQSVEGYVSANVRRAVQLAVQLRLFERVNAYTGLERFETPRFQDRLRLAEESGREAPEQMLTASVSVVRSGVLIVGFVGALLVTCPLILPPLAAAAGIGAWLQVRLGRHRARLVEGLTPLLRRQIFFGTLLTEPRAATEVRLFGLGTYLHRRMTGLLRSAHSAEAAHDRRVLRTDSLAHLLGGAVTAMGVAVAAYGVVHGRFTVGDIAIFLAALNGVHQATTIAAASVAQAYAGMLLFGHYHDIVDEPAPHAGASAPAPVLRKGIEIDDVWFRYAPDAPWVLRGVTLTIPAGTAIGLVGRNGAGKSTLVKLLCRMYEPERGTIRWDGVDVRRIDPAALRTRIGALFQDFMTYDLTAAENIGVGRLAEIDDLPAIRAAARAAGVDGALEKLPRGYRTVLSRLFVGDDGDAAASLLSGGQWQRLALARAFLRRDADLMILDEPSAGLDPEMEAEIHGTTRRLRAGRCSLLISHRLNTLRDADVIYVLDDGSVIEQGDHEHLMRVAGTYAHLFTLQGTGYRR